MTTASVDTATEMVAAENVDSQPIQDAPAAKPQRKPRTPKSAPVEPAAETPVKPKRTRKTEPVVEPISEPETPAVTTLDVLELGRWYPHAGLDGIYRENDTEVHIAVRKSGLYVRGACGLPFRAGPIASDGRSDPRVCAECAASWDTVVESLPSDADSDAVEYAVEQLARFLKTANGRPSAQARTSAPRARAATSQRTVAPVTPKREPREASAAPAAALRTSSVFRGTTYTATAAEIKKAMHGTAPGPVHAWSVSVGGVAYPPRQVVARMWGINIHSYDCMALLRAAGLEPQPVRS